MYKEFKVLKFDRRGRVLVVMIDNPPTNLVSGPMHRELSQVFTAINADPDVRVVVLTGAGDKAFSAGGDIQNMARRVEERDYSAWLTTALEAKELVYSLLRLEKPIIARINGHAIGMGANIAVLCDFSYMMAKAKIADTHVKIGLSAGDGGSLMWPLLMGFVRARQYLLTGDTMTGQQAAEFGLLTGSASTLEELDELVYGLAERLAKGPTQAINGTKASVNLLLRKMLEGVMEAHLGIETSTFLSKDHGAAVRAFLDKRDPIFTGE